MAPTLPELPELPDVPARLASDGPGWHREVDVVVVGSGVAGLTVALESADLGRVLVVTKDVLATGSTPWAQGGIAFVHDRGDSVAQHVRDTLIAGAGLCEPAAVEVLVSEGPDAVAELIERGARFDRDLAGDLLLTREGGHRHNRIAHAGGDATGAEIERALVAAVRADPRIEVIEHALVLDLLPAAGGFAAGVGGVVLHVMGAGSRAGTGAVSAGAVVLATGGIGQIYAASTNPPVSTGDGVAAALRAGAAVRDVEFIQFHPTVLYLGPDARGQLPLVSEAVRGEGARLLNAAGEAFMADRHELADLAPRDVVARAVMAEMTAAGTDHVFLDGRMLGEETWRVRFPTIWQSCRRQGINPATDPIPVAPASHYFCGGIAVDLDGATGLANLYACGEVAGTGVHGANRLASNSLLEGLVFARRIAAALRRAGAAPAPTAEDGRAPGLVDRSLVAPLQQAMSRWAGPLRDADGLTACVVALRTAAAQHHAGPGAVPGLEAWEAGNLLTVATAILTAAHARLESRGAHGRRDHPATDERWRQHLLVDRTAEGWRRTPQPLLPGPVR
ncbi:L-aspartate oxidase [Microlunatus kandeliicorticis]|uniref:L-aspartate oxidase n=1 Tax=Microlunatus kandeliicorticis TaxID=1759536 RepID=UPI002E29A53D|nr:L-aspartate oxidase [Microlunatus kandeliicorticis]